MQTIGIPSSNIFHKKLGDLYNRADITVEIFENPWTEATVGAAVFDNKTEKLVEIYIDTSRS